MNCICHRSAMVIKYGMKVDDMLCYPKKTLQNTDSWQLTGFMYETNNGSCVRPS